jgi:LPXTG-site transpeptidase (sortase) family protein
LTTPVSNQATLPVSNSQTNIVKTDPSVDLQSKKLKPPSKIIPERIQTAGPKTAKKSKLSSLTSKLKRTKNSNNDLSDRLHKVSVKQETLEGAFDFGFAEKSLGNIAVDSNKKSKVSEPQNRKLAKAFAAVGAFLFLAGGGLTIAGVIHGNTIKEAVLGVSDDRIHDEDANNPVTGISSAQGREEKPNIDAYKVAPQAPRYLKINKIGIKARILVVGLTEDSALDVPLTVHDAGWYNQSVLPGGGNGASVINGHTSGFTTSGIFHDLKDLQKDDEIIVERGDGKELKYRVVSTETVDVDNFDSAKILNPLEPGTEALNLVTCGGSFDSSSDQYSKRIIVYTKRV